MLLEIFQEHNDKVESLVGKDFAAGTAERTTDPAGRDYGPCHAVRGDVQRRTAVEPDAARRRLRHAPQPVGWPSDARGGPGHRAAGGLAPQRQGRVDRFAAGVQGGDDLIGSRCWESFFAR